MSDSGSPADGYLLVLSLDVSSCLLHPLVKLLLLPGLAWPTSSRPADTGSQIHGSGLIPAK